MPPAKKTTTAKTKNVTVKKAPVADITAEKPAQVKRPGRPPKAKTYSFTAYINSAPVEFSFEDEAEYNAAFVQICNKPFSGRPAKITCGGKQYFIGKVDYIVRDA